MHICLNLTRGVKNWPHSLTLDVKIWIEGPKFSFISIHILLHNGTTRGGILFKIISQLCRFDKYYIINPQCVVWKVNIMQILWIII